MADKEKGLEGNSALGLDFTGAGTKSRTRDLLITSRV